MRIIAGTKRGMKLLSPKTDISRPITDRVKESLFNVLNNYGFPSGKIVADLFCGVGSLGIEALSRGAEFVLFVEQDYKIIETLRKNIERAGFVKNSKVIKTNVFKVGAPVDERKYDLVFVDPPYLFTSTAGEDSPLSSLLSMVQEQVTTDSIIVVRTESHTKLLPKYGQLEVMDLRRWGSMTVALLRKIDTCQTGTQP